MAKNITLKWAIWAGLVILSLVWWQTSQVAAQETEPPEYTGLDIVFLVDQSGSMGGLDAGSQAHPKANDEYGQRFDGLRAAVQLLGPLLWQAHPECTSRIAIVEFGDNADVVLPVTTIEAQSQEDWLPQENDLLSRLEKYKKERQNRNLGNTNHQKAFRLARDLFDEMEAEDDSPRLEVIIVLTDGRPCVGTVNPDTGQRGCRPWASHLIELRDDLIPDNFPAGEDYRIYVAAINDSADNYWPSTQKYWEAIVESYNGQAEKVSTTNRVGVFFTQVLAELMNELPYPGTALEPVPLVPEEVEGFYSVVPYLQSIAFGIYKSEPGDWISLEEAGASLDTEQSSLDKKRITVTGYEPGDVMYGQIVVLHPEPGQWRIQKPPGSEVIVTVQGILFNPQLISPVGEHPLGIPARVELNLVDSDGNFVTGYSDPLYALEVVATMRTDQGEQSLDLAQEEPGVYAGLFAPRTMGTHAVHILATSHTPDGNEFTVMDQDAGVFVVGPLVAELDSPEDDVYQHVPVRLAYRFLDSRGNQIQEADTQAAALAVQVTVTGEDDTQTVTLEREESGMYAAEYTATQPGSHQLHLVVTAKDSTGREMTILEEDSGAFEVQPTIGLEYTVRPQDGTRDFIRPWWLFPTRPLEVEVEVRDENGQPIALSQVASSNLVDAFTLSVQDPAGRDRSSEMSWEMTSAPGKLRAVGKGLNDLGKWAIEVAPDFTPRPGYAMVNREATRITVIRAEHYLAWGVDGAALLGILAAVVAWWMHYKAITRPPLLTGTLYIRDASGNVVWTRPLTVGRNRVAFSGKDLPVTTRLKRISITRAPGKEDAIQVTSKLDNNSAVAASRMSFKSRRRLGTYNLYLHYEQY